MRWVPVAAIVLTSTLACSGTGGSSATVAVDDPLGVVTDLLTGDSDDLVTWTMCSEMSSTVGIFSPTKDVGFVESFTRQPTDAEPPGFQLRHQQTVGRGDLVERRYRYERTLGIDGFYDWTSPSSYPAEPSPVPTSLRTVDGLLEQLGLSPDDGDLIEADEPFVRFESLPVSHTVLSSEEIAGVDQLGLPNRSVVWVLDVWADDAGDVRRLRAMTSTGDWRELRFVESANWPQPDLDGCPERADTPSQGWLGRDGWEPTLVVPLDVTLDPAGRPYDVAVDDAVELEHRLIGRLVVPDGELRVADGISIGVSINGMQAEEFQHVDFPVTDDELLVTGLDVTMLLLAVGESTEPLAVRAEIPGRSVERWGNLEFAYGTDGGLGGLVTQRLVDVAHQHAWDMDTQPITFEDDDYSDYFFADMDRIPGDDYLTFANGFGDGAFPMAKGYDEAGDVVALVVWDIRYPWRLAVPDGTPPADVTAREQEIQRCIDDPSLVELDGSCPTAL